MFEGNFNNIPKVNGPKARKNFLTDEEYDKLVELNKQPQFTLTISETEHLKAKCNHRSKDGMQDMLEVDPIDPSKYVCKICGKRFKVIDANAPTEYVETRIQDTIDILQTIKILFVDLPAEAAGAFFDIIPLLEKVPTLFELAIKNLLKYENADKGLFNTYDSNFPLSSAVMNIYNSSFPISSAAVKRHDNNQGPIDPAIHPYMPLYHSFPESEDFENDDENDLDEE